MLVVRKVAFNGLATPVKIMLNWSVGAEVAPVGAAVEIPGQVTVMVLPPATASLPLNPPNAVPVTL